MSKAVSLSARVSARWPRAMAAVLGGMLLGLAVTAGCQKTEPTSLFAEPTADARPPEPPGPLWFRDVTEETGLHFVHDAGPTGTYFMPQMVGAGAALFDFDNDGLLDIYLVQDGGPKSASTNRLFRQGRDGRFTDVSRGSGLDIAGHNMGVAVGDVNNDGFPDVLVTQYGGLRLFRNNGNGTFTDVSKEAGLESLQWGTSAAFVDYDRDGWLDLVVVNYVNYDPSRWCGSPDGDRQFCGPNSFNGTVTRLYRNLGRVPGSKPGSIRFQDVTLEAGLGGTPGPGLGVFCADFDGDHWPDILVANDGKPNHLWINQRNGTFKEEALQRGIAFNIMGQPEANMGIAVGDVDGDGLFDIVVTHITEETHTLWRQQPRGFFQDHTAGVGLNAPAWRSTGFGTVLADFDNDGALDLALANGRVGLPRSSGSKPPEKAVPGASFWEPYKERNQLFLNDGKGRFRDISLANPPFCGTPNMGRGLACGSLRNDGGIDLLVTSLAGPARLYRNVAANRGHWLLVRALDPALHRDAYGAEVTVTAGGRRQTRWLNPGYSYVCSNDPRAHFGLGAADKVEELAVVWPDGTEEFFPGCAADQVVVVQKGRGKSKAR